MNRFLRYTTIVFAGFMLFACNEKTEGAGNALKIYVIAPNGLSSSFIADLASIVPKYGLRPNVGKAVDDKGMTLHVLDAEGPDVRLRSENVLLSGQEDSAKCGVHSEPYPDPRQYFVSASFMDTKPSNDRVEALLHNISAELKKRGYDVRSEAILCSGHTEQ